MGEPERRLWRALRESLPDVKWRSQVPFGPYHAGFCSHAAKLIVEVDGDEHALKVKSDAARTQFLRGEGYDVVRFGNAEVMANVDGVLVTIAAALNEKGRP
jgi:very-short-patch-repair endonuclease